MTRIAEQVRAGIDTVTDGEESQRYFVHGFLESLEGLALPPRSGKVERLCRRHSRADGQQANHFGFPQPIPKNPLCLLYTSIPIASSPGSGISGARAGPSARAADVYKRQE